MQLHRWNEDWPDVWEKAMLAMVVNGLWDVRAFAGLLGLLARFLLPLVGLLLLPRLAPCRARSLARWGLTVLLMGAVLPRILTAMLGWMELVAREFFATYPGIYALVHLLDDALYLAGVGLLLRALWLALPRRVAPPVP